MNNNYNHIHQFIPYDVPSTCKEQGYTLYKCACGAQQAANYKPLGYHNYVLTAVNQATCTSQGGKTVTCTVCGDTKTTATPCLGHAFGEWNMEVEPTCVKEGVKRRFCSQCGSDESEAVPIAEHNFSTKRVCPTDKKLLEHVCSECGAVVTKPNKARKIRKWAIIVSSVTVFLTAAIIALIIWGLPYYHYTSGKEALNNGKYEEAYYHFVECRNYKDTETILEDFVIKCETRSSYFRENPENNYKHHFKYDSNGNVVLHISYYANENIKNKAEYKYDEKGNMTWKVTYDTDDTVNEKTEYKYDEKGNMTWEVTYDTDDTVNEKTEYKYDDNGNMIWDISYNAKGNVIGKAQYVYDANGNKILEISYDADGGVVSKKEFLYDKNGKKTFEKHYDSSGNAVTRYEYIVNEEDDTVLEISYDNNGEESRRNEYKNGKLIYQRYYSTIVTSNGTNKEPVINRYEYEYEYNENGDEIIKVYRVEEDERVLIEESVYDSNGELKNFFIYIYDENGKLYMKRMNCENLELSDSAWYIYHNYYNLWGGVFQNRFIYDENGNEVHTLETVLDDNNVLRKIISRSTDGEIIKYHEFKYDKRGNETEVVSYDNYGNILCKQVSVYDKHGIFKSRTVYDEFGEIVEKVECSEPKVFYKCPVREYVGIVLN